MKRLIWGTAILFVVSATSSYADSIPILNVNITYATVHMGPNDGSGDNVSFTLIGPGTNITGIGGMACFDWCSGPIPDGTFVGTSQIFLSSFGSVTIRGTNYDPETLSLCCLFSASGDLNGSASGFVGEGSTFAQLNLTLPCCSTSWSLNFVPVPPEGDFPGGFQFVSGELIAGTPPAATPEPGDDRPDGDGLGGHCRGDPKETADLPKKGDLKLPFPIPWIVSIKDRVRRDKQVRF